MKTILPISGFYVRTLKIDRFITSLFSLSISGSFNKASAGVIISQVCIGWQFW